MAGVCPCAKFSVTIVPSPFLSNIPIPARWDNWGWAFLALVFFKPRQDRARAADFLYAPQIFSKLCHHGPRLKTLIIMPRNKPCGTLFFDIENKGAQS